jgi:glycyl-tRNA synthetase beta chain
MPELLVELLTEEIPARMQGLAAAELKRLVEIAFGEAALKASSVATYVTPRRLVLVVEGLPAAQPGAAEERRGPRVGAPEQAVQGFLKAAGLATLEQCEKRATDKGEFYFVMIHRPGRATAAVLPGLLRKVIETLPWPKSMRFPAARFRWVRPLTGVVAIFDGAVLPLELDDIPVGNTTIGHRFLGKIPFAVDDFDDYRKKLRTARVILDAEERKTSIADWLSKVASEAGLTLKPDDALLGEVTGLVEWPVVLMGRIEPEFMELPPEVLTTSMRTHQKYFACLDKKDALAARFLFVANMIAEDGGKAIVAGNERVLRARLSDAKFFWDQDRKVKLESRVPKLKERVFHAKLGSVLDKVVRITKLAEALVPHVKGADAGKVKRAAELMKADLSTGMVGEFPELQGVMGRYYALHDGEAPEVAQAIAEHYSPLGPSDRCPSAPTSVAVSLADKIDSLVGFFSIDEKPTGSKDPFALRRAAQGVIRLILENKLRISLRIAFVAAYRSFGSILSPDPEAKFLLEVQLLDFFADRLKVQMRGDGFGLLGEAKVLRLRHDLIAAVFALHEDDLVRLLARGSELAAFLATEDGANLLVAYRRAMNIVRIEERRDGRSYSDEPLALRLDEPLKSMQEEERELRVALAGIHNKITEPIGREAFEEAMTMLAQLRKPVDDFFNKVTVNVPEQEVRTNRLRLLAGIGAVMNLVADFSKVEG